MLSSPNFRKMGFQPSVFPFHPQLFEIECQGQKEHFCSHICLSLGQETAESKVIFEQRKCPLHLNGAAHTQICSSFGRNICLRFSSLFPKGLFQGDFLWLICILCLTAGTAFGTVFAVLTAIMGSRYKMSALQFSCLSDQRKLSSLSTGKAVFL